MAVPSPPAGSSITPRRHDGHVCCAEDVAVFDHREHRQKRVGVIAAVVAGDAVALSRTESWTCCWSRPDNSPPLGHRRRRELARHFDWASLPQGTELLTGRTLDPSSGGERSRCRLGRDRRKRGLAEHVGRDRGQETVALANKENIGYGRQPGESAGDRARRHDPAGR